MTKSLKPKMEEKKTKLDRVGVNLIFVVSLMVMLSFSVMAFSQPLSSIPASSMKTFAIENPISPDTGYSGECNPWAIKGEYCEGDVRHYTQCQQTVSGGVWAPHSEVCTDYGVGTTCLAGKCMQKSDIFASVAFGFLFLAGGGFFTFLLVKKVRGGKRRR